MIFIVPWRLTDPIKLSQRRWNWNYREKTFQLVKKELMKLPLVDPSSQSLLYNWIFSRPVQEGIPGTLIRPLQERTCPLYPSQGKILTLTRDLKVEILARRFWKEYLEPTMPEFDISLFLPQLSKIKSVADKMKHINKYIIVRAYKDGRFQLRTKGSTIKTTVNFPKCERPEWQNTEEKWVT